MSLLRWLQRRVTGTTDAVKLLAADPKSAGPMMRDSTVKLWRARGGGFYGLGYVICFGVLQVRTFTEQVSSVANVGEFIVSEIGSHLLRFGIDSLVNGFLSLLWPAFVIERFQGWGILMIGVGFWTFDRWLKPLVREWLPELRRRRKRRRRRSRAPTERNV